MKVILISGKAQHGKDTVASLIKKELEAADYKVLIAHYADLLKYICKTFFGWDGKKDEAGRHILQYVGTDVIREQQPDFWVSFIKQMLELFPDTWDYVLIPDTRFPNEISCMKPEFDTVHLKVNRTNFDNQLSEEQQNHPSETALDNVTADEYILNDGTLKDLRTKVYNFLERNSCFQQMSITEGTDD